MRAAGVNSRSKAPARSQKTVFSTASTTRSATARKEISAHTPHITHPAAWTSGTGSPPSATSRGRWQRGSFAGSAGFCLASMGEAWTSSLVEGTRRPHARFGSRACGKRITTLHQGSLLKLSYVGFDGQRRLDHTHSCMMDMDRQGRLFCTGAVAPKARPLLKVAGCLSEFSRYQVRHLMLRESPCAGGASIAVLPPEHPASDHTSQYTSHRPSLSRTGSRNYHEHTPCATAAADPALETIRL